MANFLVTGAKGAVGREICRKLRQQKHDLVATDFTGAPDSEDMRYRYVDLDLTSPEAGEELVEMATGADYIIHTAAVVDIGADPEIIRKVNIKATRLVIDAATKNRVISLVHISSGSIYAPSDKILTEDSPLLGSSAYERSKIESEELVNDLCFINGIHCTILRPALIYGPNCRYLGASLAAIPTILRETLGEDVPGLRGGPRTNWAHVQDVAAACIHCATTRDCYDRTFNICDSEGLGFGDVITMYLEEAGLNVYTRIPLPSPAMMRFLRPVIEIPGVVELLSKLASHHWGGLKEERRLGGKKIEDQLVVKIDREATPYLYEDMVFDNTAIKRTGFIPQFDHPRNGIKNTMAWYKKQKWVW
jgi:nucleoside-diphosphate-sugar epimerase